MGGLRGLGRTPGAPTRVAAAHPRRSAPTMHRPPTTRATAERSATDAGPWAHPSRCRSPPRPASALVAFGAGPRVLHQLSVDRRIAVTISTSLVRRSRSRHLRIANWYQRRGATATTVATPFADTPWSTSWKSAAAARQGATAHTSMSVVSAGLSEKHGHDQAMTACDAARCQDR